MSEGAGKGDKYRPTNLKSYNETLTAIFGERDPADVQRCRKICISAKKVEVQRKENEQI